MTQEITHLILHKTIKNLDVSKEFKAMAKANGFKTLQNILDMPLHELPYKPQSGYRMLKEFLDMMEEYSLSNLLDEEAC
jgi:DNA-directed RNA polymerase alpha subunit